MLWPTSSPCPWPRFPGPRRTARRATRRRSKHRTPTRRSKNLPRGLRALALARGAPTDVSPHGEGDPSQPRRELFGGAQPREALKGPDERLLSELLGFLSVAGDRQRNAIDPPLIPLHQLSEGCPVSPLGGRDELEVGLALAVLAGLAMQAGVSPVEAAKKRLTCSFIKKQCIKECSKQVDASFCKSYCDDRRQECLQTGRWDGIERQFKNVRKR